MSIRDIINGHSNELLNINEELSKSRLEICKDCKLFSEKWYGIVCDRNKWVDKNDIVYNEYVPNATRGCGCRLEAKSRNEDNVCPLKKWTK